MTPLTPPCDNLSEAGERSEKLAHEQSFLTVRFAIGSHGLQLREIGGIKILIAYQATMCHSAEGAGG